MLNLKFLLLFSNAVTLRRDKSILFSRTVIIGLMLTSFLAYTNLYLRPLEKGLGIYGGLINVSTYTQTFNIFIFLISAVILILTAFYTRKIHIKILSSIVSMLVNIAPFALSLCIFLITHSIDISFIYNNTYLLSVLKPYSKINIFILLIINLLMFIYVNIYNIVIFGFILFNTNFLLTNFKSKHINYSFRHKFENIKENLINVIFARLIATPFVVILMFLLFSLSNITTSDVIITVYITQVPLTYINYLSHQLYLKFINIDNFNIMVINHKVYMYKPAFYLHFNLYNNVIIDRVNFYNLSLRIVVIYILSLATTSVLLVTVLFGFLIYSCYYYLPEPKGIPGFTPIKSAIPMTIGGTLGLGTAIMFSLNNCEYSNINAENVLSIAKENPQGQQTLFTHKTRVGSNISGEDINLIEKSNILKLLEAINVEKPDFYDESIEKEFISTNRNNGTVMAYKKFNNQTTCVLINRLDTKSTDYYPSYYTNQSSVNKLHNFLVDKYLIDKDKDKDKDNVSNIIVFTQRQPLGDSLHKVWRISAGYDSFIYKLDKHMAKVTSFPEPQNGINKIDINNDHFQSLEVVNALNGCLEDKEFFDRESHYSGVFTEYLHYAKTPKQILSGEHNILGTRIDHLIQQRSGNVKYTHTYVERKAPNYQEYMLFCRGQNLQYVSMDNPWSKAKDVHTVYGINTIGLNLEFNEYKQGFKGLVEIEDKYEDISHTGVEMYSIISDTDCLKMKLQYSNRYNNVKGDVDFLIYKEHGALDNINDSEFIKKCRLYQLK